MHQMTSVFLIKYIILYLFELSFLSLGYSSIDLNLESNKANLTVGTCWYNFERNSNKCSGMYMDGVLQSECCAAGSQGHGWTPSLLNEDYDFFQYVVLGRGIEGCTSCQPNCDDLTCGNGEICQMVGGEAMCICGMSCRSSKAHNADDKMVCGIDGRTYSSECSLHKHNCRHRQNNYVDYPHQCQQSCKFVNCTHGKHCIEDQIGKPHCVMCIMCNEDNGMLEVCGNDGITYPSACHLHRHACLNHMYLLVEAYHGPCLNNASCSLIECELGLTCVTEVNTLNPICIDCNQISTCISDSNICASNGITFSSHCHMISHACKTQTFLQTIHSGSCINNDLIQ